MVRPAQSGSSSSAFFPFPQIKPVSNSCSYLCTCVHSFCDPKSHGEGRDRNTDLENRVAVEAWGGMQVMSWVCEEMELGKKMGRRKENEGMLRKLMKTIVCGIGIWLERSGTKVCREGSSSELSEAVLFGYSEEKSRKSSAQIWSSTPFWFLASYFSLSSSLLWVKWRQCR